MREERKDERLYRQRESEKSSHVKLVRVGLHQVNRKVNQDLKLS